MHLLARTTSTTPKLLARQWLVLYQQGPVWVPPLIYTGFFSNLYVAFSPSSNSFFITLHITAAALTFSIIPITFLYLEPGINGACKWKVEMLLRDAKEGGGGGFSMPSARTLPSVVRHSVRGGWQRWAERVEMADLVVTWARLNHARWVLGVVAGMVSFVASRGSMLGD
ncbi:hypothetical protein N657DRAFT_569457 [Parathielavia appendiculata]|uniref:Uncharacterized protein n=1 Tax=Parathielavia appendiculata TaxID=2587402 RepID=A0AAN6U3Q0_9PEZI|nr:hypothetical protein N657DRAFT_569457 [Parathielavia appendiculata]